MRAIDLNLASRPFKNNTLLWVGYLLAFVLLAAFTAWNIITWREHIEKLADLQDTVQSIEGRIADLDLREERAELGIKSYDLNALEIQAAKANEVIEWKAFSWTRLFNKMERIQPYNVRMTSIRPLFRGGKRRSILKAIENEERQSVAVAVEGIAKDFGAFWEMQNVLLTDDHFGQVDPERLNRSESREIVFQLSFLYFPDTEEPPQEEEIDSAKAAEAEEPAEAVETVEVEQPAAEADEQAAQRQAEEPETIVPEADPAPVVQEKVEQPSEEQPQAEPRRTRFTKGRRGTKGGETMTSRRIKFDIRQAGKRIAIILLAWLLLNTGFYLIATRPKVRDYRSLMEGSEPQLQALEKRKQEVEARENYLDALKQAEFDLTELRREVFSTRTERMVEVQQEVERLCGQFNIDFNSVTYDSELLMGQELDKMIMVVPLQGNYASLRKFLQAVEGSDKFLLVERVALAEGKEGGVMLQLSITLATYFNSPLRPEQTAKALRRQGGGEA